MQKVEIFHDIAAIQDGISVDNQYFVLIHAFFANGISLSIIEETKTCIYFRTRNHTCAMADL